MRIKIKEEFESEGITFEKGNTYDVEEGMAESAIEKGYAEEADEGETPTIEKPEESEESEESSEGVDVEGFMKSEGGWLTAGDVEEGDKIKILGSGEIDDETFDSSYLNVPVEHNGDQLNLRLGKRNTKRIVKEYGNNTQDWVGKKIQVVSIEDYPQLDSKGMILKPVK